MTIRALIVDDEPWARKRVAALLKAEPDFEIAGECADGRSAAQSIAALNPDVVFLDIQMPGMDGFETLEALGPAPAPLIVFVTAYDKYAIQAFEVSAIDYLLKPFDAERFRKTLERIRHDIRSDQQHQTQDLAGLLQYLKSGRKYLRRIGAKTGRGVVFLRIEDIDWIEASGNYVTLHSGKEEHLLRESMHSLESKLDPDQFVRIQRSTIVNLDRVKQLQPWFHGEQVLVLKDGRQLTVGRAFRERLQRFLDNAPPQG